MSYSSLLRVVALVLPLGAACAHEVTDMPEQIGSDDSPVVGTAGSLSSAGKTASGGGGTGSVQGQGGTKAATAGASSTGGVGAAPSMDEGGSPGTGEGGEGTAQGGTTAAGANSGGGLGGVAAGGAGAGGKGGSAGAGGKGGSGGGAGSAGAAGKGGSGGTGPVGECASVSKWKAGTYQEGDQVQAGSKLYECKAYPYTGWCGMDAYAPGVTAEYWPMAWTLVGPC